MFPTWKTIKLGTGLKTADDFYNALKSTGNIVNRSTWNWTGDILNKPAFKAAAKEIEVDLVNLSVAELGFRDGATLTDIYERAISLGLELCPNEVGPQLRLQYEDQPKGEYLSIAMEPLTALDGSPIFFLVGNLFDELFLGAGRCGLDNGFLWVGAVRFVFVRPRK